MSKYYTVSGGNLYIYVTGSSTLLDLRMFPTELGLFEAECSWRVSPWIAILDDVTNKAFDGAKIILQLEGYEETPVDGEVLESYFLHGNESVLRLPVSVPPRTRRGPIPAVVPAGEETDSLA